MPSLENSLSGTLANIVANIVGAGLLSLPATLKQAGLVPGIFLQLLVCALNTASMLCIAHSCELSNRFTYKEQGEFALGKVASLLITIVMALYTLGSLISFTVLIGDNLPALVCENGCNGSVQAFFGNRAVAIILSALLVLLPLSLLRNLSALRYTSSVSSLCILYIGLMIGVRCIAGDPPRAPLSEIDIGSSNALQALATAPVTAVAYTLHYNAARYFYELRERTL
jgi:solute carrier family 38 (sodium-coupled neutral amino acid transporter), member 11